MHILIANNDEALYRITEEALKGHHYVLPLPEDVQLIPYLRENPTDAIVITLSSDASGFRTYDIVKRIPEVQGKPIIFLADGQNEEYEKKALLLGVDDYLTLPMTSQLLLHKINTQLQLAYLRKKKSYIEVYEEEISVIFAKLVECRDLDTGDHLINTTRYFKLLFNAALESEQFQGLVSEEDMHDVIRSAMLHDIGKIGILDGILRKESSLDFDEYEHMKTHTILGKQAFENIIQETGGSKWLYLAKDMAYYHHERWDGTGYPDGLKGEDIPFFARMLTIADVYDALTSNRAYKKAFSHRKAVEIIKAGRGSFYDPSLVDLFIKVNKRFEETLKYSHHARR